MIEVIHMTPGPNIIKRECDKCGRECNPKSDWLERHMYWYKGETLCAQCTLDELEWADVIEEVKE